MHPLGEPMQHLQLLARMAKALGVDLTEAFHRGEISAEDWAEMITSCCGCDGPEGCKRWLDAQERAGGAVPAGLPLGQCCNAARLLHLREGSP
ncbi:DUF6455 family protein [Pseudophaeobacter flagellatus]|uniref:DUF6455 family protein n=1 Tax=Pseudophaeobacter flagellatus TaxID=2899119 RepID=UPI001E3D3E81|nr:DUF6455 family protein [Pseudophaeobacter flagellatus]MCD9149508.1 DUF6455 family protein [Pseudophaeobacter flagellatus]